MGVLQWNEGVEGGSVVVCLIIYSPFCADFVCDRGHVKSHWVIDDELERGPELGLIKAREYAAEVGVGEAGGE